MSYIFPSKITPDEMASAVSSVDGIAIIPLPHRLWLYDYIYSHGGMFLHPGTDRNLALRLECRGMILSESGGVIRRSPHKFFNLGQEDWLHPENIDWTVPHHVFEKIDGSLICPYFDERIIWGTRKGDTAMSSIVADWIKNQSIAYSDFVHACIERRATPFFEWVSSDTPIIINYQEDSLTLLGVRNMDDGTYWSHHEVTNLACQFEIPVVKVFREPFASLEEFENFRQHQVQEVENIEGFVIRFDTGLMVKVKTRWYHTLSYNMNSLQTPKQIWQIVLDSDWDDIQPIAPSSMHWISDFDTAVQQGLTTIAHRMEQEIAPHRHLSQKEFSQWVRQTVDRDISTIYYSIYKGYDARESCLRLARSKINHADILFRLTGVRMEDYSPRS